MALTQAPGRFRHAVDGGAVDVGITDVNGRIQAVLRGCDVEMKKSFHTAAAARNCVRRSFRELFPGHRCGQRCG